MKGEDGNALHAASLTGYIPFFHGIFVQYEATGARNYAIMTLRNILISRGVAFASGLNRVGPVRNLLHDNSSLKENVQSGADPNCTFCTHITLLITLLPAGR